MTKALAKVFSAELEGIDGRLIEVEVDLHAGLHSFLIVGLADKALNEARERVNSALKNCGVKPPNRENRKVTINLAPADVKKSGSHYDLAIALGYLLATEQIKQFDAQHMLFVGELALDGRIRAANGALNIAQMAKEKGFKFLFVPAQNAEEASAISGIAVIPLETLHDAIEMLEGRKIIAPAVPHEEPKRVLSAPNFSHIKGQENAKRAAMIAAAGGHNLLMIGSPGVGKSLLAQAMIGILPDLTQEEAIEITKIYSAAGASSGALIHERPFRSPHQTASLASLIGGGSDPRPGEISLSHRGVLFLDELPEFQKNALEALRAPLETGAVHVARAKKTLTFPARFTLVAAMNPCPCGYFGDTQKQCRCSAYDVMRYQRKISGPLLDRIDLQLRVPRVAIAALRAKEGGGESSETIKIKVEDARARQKERFKKLEYTFTTNAEMSGQQAEHSVNLTASAELFLSTLHKSKLSPRGYYRLLKTARTIADLEAHTHVTEEHLAEAFSYRLKEEI